MALAASHWQMTVSLVGLNGRTVRRTYRLTSSAAITDITTLKTEVGNLAFLLAACSACAISKVELSLVYLENDLTLPTDSQADSAMQAVITAKIRGRPNESAVLTIPGPKDALFKAPSGRLADEVDVTHTQLNSILGRFDSTVGNTYTLSDGESIDRATAKGVRKHRLTRPE